MRIAATLIVLALVALAGLLVARAVTGGEDSYRGVSCSADFTDAEARLGTAGADRWLVECLG